MRSTETIIINTWPNWMTLEIAARYSSIGQKRLVTLSNEGEIVSGMIGGKRFFSRTSIDDYFNRTLGVDAGLEKGLALAKEMCV